MKNDNVQRLVTEQKLNETYRRSNLSSTLKHLVLTATLYGACAPASADIYDGKKVHFPLVVMCRHEPVMTMLAETYEKKWSDGQSMLEYLQHSAIVVTPQGVQGECDIGSITVHVVRELKTYDMKEAKTPFKGTTYEVYGDVNPAFHYYVLTDATEAVTDDAKAEPSAAQCEPGEKNCI